MNRQLVKDAFGWGFVLWSIGYILGIALFFVVPQSLIGWVITPIAFAITLSVLLRRVKGDSLRDYAIVAMVWTIMAIALDYLLIVKAFNPPDGYYKLDVYLYYGLTFLLPLIVGWRRARLGHRRDR
jgi:uncharacterized membrane protein